MVVGGDGREASMCGNGLVYASDLVADSEGGLTELVVETASGIREVRRDADARGWCVSMGEVDRDPSLESRLAGLLPPQFRNIQCFDSGEPHAVLLTFRGARALDELSAERFAQLGRAVYAASSLKGGINFNLIALDACGAIRVRTFERGVRRETRACGTGALASYAAAVFRGAADPAGGIIKTRGGAYRARKTDKGFHLTTAPSRGSVLPVEALFERSAA